jgi:hypothetical protein
MSIEKSCDNCISKDGFCNPIKSKYCINLSSHEFTCDYCKWRLKDNIKFCEMDDLDDGFSCCHGDKFELNEIYK